jgi:hypothetical protein
MIGTKLKESREATTRGQKVGSSPTATTETVSLGKRCESQTSPGKVRLIAVIDQIDFYFDTGLHDFIESGDRRFVGGVEFDDRNLLVQESFTDDQDLSQLFLVLHAIECRDPDLEGLIAI